MACSASREAEAGRVSASCAGGHAPRTGERVARKSASRACFCVTVLPGLYVFSLRCTCTFSRESYLETPPYRRPVRAPQLSPRTPQQLRDTISSHTSAGTHSSTRTRMLPLSF